MQFYFVERELADVGVDFYIIAVGEFTGQKLGYKQIFKPLLNTLLRYKNHPKN